MGIEFLIRKIDEYTGYLSSIVSKIEINIEKIKIKELDNALQGLTIAQISDLHISKYNIELIEEAVKRLNELNPDVVVMTGDAICQGKKFIADLERIFRNISSRYGVYACLGNHDHSDGDDGLRVQSLYKNCNAEILVNSSSCINIRGERLYIAGVDDIELVVQDFKKITENISEEGVKIFLAHNPINFQEFAEYKPHLVLSGHTHGGQLYFNFLEFIYRLRLNSPYITGLYRHNESVLYINKGIGTTLFTPDIFGKRFYINTPRINTSPEISVFKLEGE